MEIQERIDVSSILRSTGSKSLVTGLILFFVVPGVGTLFGLLVRALSREGRFPIQVGIVIAISALYGASFLWTSLQNRLHPERRKEFLWPEIGTPAEVRAAVERDWNDSPVSVRFRSNTLFLTPKWLIECDKVRFLPTPLQSVTWVYLVATENHVNNLKIATTYTVNIHCNRQSRPIAVYHGTEELCITLLGVLRARAPWAVFGHNEAIAKKWDNEMQAFCQMVKTRYASALSGDVMDERDLPADVDVLVVASRRS